MKRIFLFLAVVACVGLVQAQPQKRRVTSSNAAAQKKQAHANDRASLQFPTKDAMPEDVVWKRDVYRSLDLTKDENAPLYYPVEPMGRQVNLFTFLFRLMLTGRINAYMYKLDGVENFEDKNKLKVEDVLTRYSIYYEEPSEGKYQVDDSDIPSAEVTRYYLKESVYLDQRTGTFQTKVTALCPVLMRGADEWGGDSTPYPMFWLNYDEVAPWLARLPMMASNLNNVMNMTADDYFTTTRYKGQIYKTNNMQGRALAQYCKTDSAMKSEQNRIEKQIVDFEDKVWGHMSHEDSIKAAQADSIKAAQGKVRKTRSVFSSARRSGGSSVSSGSSKTTKSKSGSGGGNSAPRISVRRQRR
ncbi:MAG: gliding motility protein GldN [Bacteroidaceae bacterium]|nr:gliding motility protein GldN [Bacteroidaceae bacterium]